VAALGVFLLGACKAFDVTDPNNPALEELQSAPTRSLVTTAATGLLVAARTGIAALHLQLGIMGRETYFLSSDDPRFVTELLIGPLQGGSFGGGHWAARYANIRNANIVLDAVEKVAAFTAAERAGIRGFAKTIQALDLFEVIVTRDNFGAPIDVNRDPRGAPAPIASRQEVYNRVITLLNEGQTDLQAAGTSLALLLSPCFADFNTPATFLKFNRALRARVAMYLNDFQGVLTALQGSFIDPAGSLNLGAYHCFGTASGDVQNTNYDPTGRAIRGHPSFLAQAQRRADGSLDLRAQTKNGPAPNTLTAQGVSSDKLVTVYSGPADSIPIIRNEELILLRAEANVGLNNLATAVTDINVVRTRSGGLLPYVGPVTQAALLDEVLYNKRYSLYFEGQRWADLRRYNRLSQLPRDLPTHRIFTQWPFPLNECLARGETTGPCTAVTGTP
jgi:hypothetical protein